MLRHLAVLLFGGLLALPASAANYDFDGLFRVTASSGTCTNYDPVGDHLFARLRYRIPQEVDNWDTILTLFGDGYGRGYAIDVGYPSTSWKSVENIYIGGGGWGPDDSVATVYLKQLSLTVVPAGSINANTKFIDIVGQIYNYDFMPGCVVTFSASLQKRP
jgi:hypothetical protein